MKIKVRKKDRFVSGIVMFLCLILLFPFQLVAQVDHSAPANLPTETNAESKRYERIPIDELQEVNDSTSILIPTSVAVPDSLGKTANDTVTAVMSELRQQQLINQDSIDQVYLGKERIFNPNPTRAVWLSALFPGLGQIYNRSYWKLPIVVGGFVGISYAVSWNNKMLTDYTNAYRDAMDNDPNTNSYMDFYPPTVQESDIDKAWLQKTLKSKKDFYRRNRDLSIICMVGMYFICMVDAYVDASLSQFDISPDLSMKVLPTMLETSKNGTPAVGIQWALNF